MGSAPEELIHSTVTFHLTGLMTKLGARNRVELVIRAYETGRMR